MSDLYFLNEDHTYRPCSIEEWSNQCHTAKNREKTVVAFDLILDKRISTVWLGIDHNFLRKINERGPILFETMVFNRTGHEEIYLDRYETWDEALSGHKDAIKWVIDGCKDEEL